MKHLKKQEIWPYSEEKAVNRNCVGAQTLGLLNKGFKLAL